MRQTRLFNSGFRLLLAAIFAAVSIGVSSAYGADAKAGKAKAGICAGCHGLAGQSPQPIWPNIAGQGSVYFARQLRAFKSKARAGAQMAPIVATLSEDDIDNLAAYFATLPAAHAKADPSVVEAGQQLYRGGDAKRGVPACMSCHGPSGKGMNAAGFPAVSGQHAQYSLMQLQAFASGTRGDSDAGKMMSQIASRLDQASMRSVAEYMAGLR